MWLDPSRAFATSLGLPWLSLWVYSNPLSLSTVVWLLYYILYRFKVIVLIAFLAAVSAFAPGAQRATSSSVVSMNAARSKSLPFLTNQPKLDGSMAGDEGFDPLGLPNLDASNLGIDLYWMREAELKHSRVAMLAIFGALMQEGGFIVPGLPTAKNQVTAFWDCLDNNPGPIFASVIFFGIVEFVSGVAITEGKKNGRAPGDYGFNPLNLGNSEKAAKEFAVKEIRNGRLAMWAAAGMLIQGATTSDGALGNLFQ